MNRAVETNHLVIEIRKLRKQGEKDIYINAVNCTVKEIIELKRMIKRGILTPDIKMLNRMIKEEYIHEFLKGKEICPQMVYHFSCDMKQFER